MLTGFQMDGATCDTGAYGAFGGCEFVRDGAGNLVAVIEPLAPGDGITVGGRFTGLTEPTPPAFPAEPEAISFGFRPLGLAVLALGVAAATIVYLVGRRIGSNTVAGGGSASEAAFGDLPLPGGGRVPADVATYRVPDSRLAEMATIEFAPPRGLEPWQSAALLSERVDDDTVNAWFSEMIACGAIDVVEDDDTITLSRGPGTAQLCAVDHRHLDRLFADGPVELGEYDSAFAGTWAAIKSEQRGFVRTAGWWGRGGPGGAGMSVAGALVLVATIVAVVAAGIAVAAFAVTSGGFPWRGVLSAPVALVAGFVVPLVVALMAYSPMFASRTATGSALALRSESFRRFLAASEGKHVEWAWQHGLLREYSAWAVALGAAGAWSDAIRASNIPEPSVALAGPLVMHSHSSAFSSTHVAPSSSGGGGGGGGVGGGGGGGSSGSW